MLSGGSGMNKLNNAFLRSKNGVLLQEVSFRDFELGPKRKESGLIGSNFNESRKELTSRTSLISVSMKVSKLYIKVSNLTFHNASLPPTLIRKKRFQIT